MASTSNVQPVQPLGRRRRDQGALPRGGPCGARRASAARLPCLVAHVPRSDPSPVRHLSPHRAGLSRVRHSVVPARTEFGYTFDHVADVVGTAAAQLGVGKFTMYVMCGAPIGYRLALRRPDQLCAIVMQNAPLYPEAPTAGGPGWANIGRGIR